MRRSKYGVSAKSDRTLNGKVYMSKLEMNYRKHLGMLRGATLPKEKVIKIDEQVPFEIVVNGKKICTYFLDFKVIYGDLRIEYVDVKGVKTDIYRLKKKLVEACYPINIREIKKGDF